jgi:hypothetical protein
LKTPSSPPDGLDGQAICLPGKPSSVALWCVKSRVRYASKAALDLTHHNKTDETTPSDKIRKQHFPTTAQLNFSSKISPRPGSYLIWK